jgi:hypothetical protein
MNTAPHAPQTHKPRLALALLLTLVAATLGGVLGFDFARQAGGGLGMSLLTGAAGALFSTLLADALASRLARRR